MSDKGTPFSYIKSKVGDNRYIEIIDNLTMLLSNLHRPFYHPCCVRHKTGCDICRAIDRARKLIGK